MLGLPIGRAQTASIDGRDFSGIDLPALPQREPVSISSNRCSVWKERQTNRMFLEGDVDIVVGPYRFLAERAVVWLEPIRVGSENGDQVAFYFEQVRMPGGEASIAQQADVLLVTAITYGHDVRMRTDRLERGRIEDPLVIRGEERLARYLNNVIAPPSPTAAPLDIDTIPPSQERVARLPEPGAGEYDPLPLDQNPELARIMADDTRGLGPAQRMDPIFASDAIVTLYAPETEAINTNDGRQAVVFSDGVAVQVQPVGTDPPLQLRSDRAVVFLAHDAAGIGQYTVSDIQGIFLEGDVLVTSGDYTIRSGQVYYDIAGNRAILLEAVFSAFDRKSGMPLYVRADAIRQVSERQWTSGDVLISNVAFAEPHFAIGARDVTITQTADGTGAQTDAGSVSLTGLPTGRSHEVQARQLDFRVGTVPALTLNNVSGELRTSPIRRVAFESTDGEPVVKTTWDLYALLGKPRPSGVNASLLLDAYTSRGPAGGVEFEWDSPDATGSFLAYTIWDNGEDHLTSGAKIDQDDEWRGIAVGEQVWQLSRDWTLFLEASYISDETFVDAFFESWAETRRPFWTGGYARQRGPKNTAFTLDARGTLHDFVPNEYLMQSLGYQTQRLPELSYRGIGVDLFDGLLSYTGEVRAGRFDNVFIEPTARELGFNSRRRAQAALGIDPNESPADRLRRAGVPESDVWRFDTRHEFEMPIKAGAFNIVPFGVGRFTAYDDDFDQYSPQEDDSYRLWGGAGVRIGTSLTRIDNSAHSEFFDVNRMRHIIEPSLTFWHGEANLGQEDLPIFDDSVESLSTGTAVNFGLRNTWQTKRGRHGKQYTVDFITMQTDVMWSSSEIDRESPFG